MSNENKAFIVGIFIGCITINVIEFAIDFIRDFPGAQARAAIERCEVNLPRNQNCVITAIPK